MHWRKIKLSKKKAFTFLELIIVVLLVSAVYSLFFSNFDLFSAKKAKSINVKNIKTYLLENYSFNEKIELLCIDEGFECFVFLDNEITKDNKIENLFKSKPEIYEYYSSLNIIEYSSLSFDNHEDHEVCFKFSINRDRKSNEMVVSYNDKAYIFTSINEKAEEVSYLNDIADIFDNRIIEVKDAF